MAWKKKSDPRPAVEKPPTPPPPPPFVPDETCVMGPDGEYYDRITLERKSR